MSWVAHISIDRLFSLEFFGKSGGLSAESVAILGIALILRIGFDSPLGVTLFRLTICWTLTSIFRQLGCRVLGNNFSITITACTYFITTIGYWLFEIYCLPSMIATVVAKGWDLAEINILLTLMGLASVSSAMMWKYGNLFGLFFQWDDSNNNRDRLAAIKDLIDEVVTASRVKRMNPQNQFIERPEVPSIHIRQNIAVYLIQALIQTTRGFTLSERHAADLRHRSDRWTEELKEDSTYLTTTGLRESQMFVSYILQLNYLYRINNEAASLGEGVQQEVMNWIKSVAHHPRNQLYIQQAQRIVRKYTTAATLSTLDGIILPLPTGLEPVDNGTFIRCLCFYMVYLIAKEWTEIRVLTKYILPTFFIYRYLVNRRGLLEEGESHPLINALTPKNFYFLFKVLTFVFIFHITHSSRMKKLLPKVARNSLLFNFLRFGIIPLYLSLRRYINANWEVLR
jgi:hypothetical protein